MQTYIALLRGINVSGQKMIKMADLKSLLEKQSFSNIQTYLQSGNVVFQSSLEDKHEISSIIQNAINENYGFDVPTLVLTATELETIVHQNPFLLKEELSADYFHVTFLASPSQDIDEVVILEKKSATEQISFSAQAIYLYCPDGYGKTKLHNGFLEKQTKVTATTRNWKTSLHLMELSK